ncbi:MAG: family transposase [Massilia sp.]|nr:family transposase [Massilia sp.]
MHGSGRIAPRLKIATPGEYFVIDTGWLMDDPRIASFSASAKRFYDRKKARTNGAVATKAVAHKIARACYHMLKEQTVFDEKRCFS